MKSALASQAASRSRVAGRGAFRGAFGRAGEDRAEVHRHVAELDLGEAAQARGDERAVLGVALDDEAAAVAAAPGLDEAGLAQDAESLAHGDQRDAEPAGELGLARQPLAGVEHAEHDAVGEALGDLLGAARCRRAGRTRLRVRPVPPSTPCVQASRAAIRRVAARAEIIQDRMNWRGRARPPTCEGG